MRLTLRTLLAWLDDTLPPKDVARIGRQLHGSKFAQDLSRRIKRVVRQRRLTVPGMGSNTPIDSNIIAAYLDNNLASDQTAAVESLALNSDVHLAEIAAAHEILSLLEQPIETDTNTYAKMYRLVKGPEARIQSDRWLKQTREQEIKHQNLVQHEQERGNFDYSELPVHSEFSRHRPKFIAGILILGSIMLSLSHWLDLNSGTRSAINPNAVRIPTQVLDNEEAETVLNPDPANPVVLTDSATESNALPKPDKPTLKVETTADQAKGKSVSAPLATAEKQEQLSPLSDKKPSVMVDDVFPLFKALLPKSRDSIFLISETSSDQTGKANSSIESGAKNWKKLSPEDTVSQGFARFASAEPTEFSTSAVDIKIQSGSLIEWRSSGVPIFWQGQIRVESKNGCSITFRIDEKNEVKLTVAPESTFFMSRISDLAKLSDLKAASGLNPFFIIVEKGSTDLIYSNKTAQSTKSKAISLNYQEASSVLDLKELSQIPSVGWPTDTVSAKMTTDLVNRYLSSKRALPVGIMDAVSDKSRSVRDLALSIAVWIDRDDIIINALTDLGSSELRASAIDAVRKSALIGSGAAPRIMNRLAQELELDPETTELLKKLFGAYVSNSDLAWKKVLVRNLQNPILLIRQLTLEHLMKIAGRDDMGYRPENPTKKGFEAWQSWLGMDGEEN